MAPRCLSRENADRTVTVLYHALCVDDFDQTPVSVIFSETVPIFFYCFFFVGDAIQVTSTRCHTDRQDRHTRQIDKTQQDRQTRQTDKTDRQDRQTRQTDKTDRP